MNNNPNTTEKRPLPRMRTIAKALEEISAEDPNTALTSPKSDTLEGGKMLSLGSVR